MDSRPLRPDDPSRPDAPAPRAAVDGGRLGVYAALGASTGAVPIPFVPGWLASRVRGSLVADVAAHHGVALTEDARAALSDSLGQGAPRGLAANALRFVGGKLVVRTLARLGPAGALFPLGGALRIYALGHLLDRYFDRHRPSRAPTLDVVEAQRVRKAIDAALAHALRVEPVTDPSLPAVGEARDSTTALVDRVLSIAAGVPARFVRRIDAAFDETIAHVPR